MSEITSQTNSQHLIDIEEDKTVFDCGHEIHTVTIRMGITKIQFFRHLGEDGRISENQSVNIHALGQTEINVFEKVKKTAKRFSNFVRTRITAVVQ